MPGEKTYKVGNDIFEIPEREVSNFLKDNPRAVEVNSFIVGKDTLDIPLSETDSFLKEVPDAQPLKKKDQKTPSPLLSPSSGSVSGSTAGALVPTGINYLTGENFTAPAPKPLEIPQNQNPGLMAAGTTAETTPKDQSQFSPEIQQGGAALGDKTESLMRGVARLGNSVLKTPGFLYDVATAVTNNVINKPFGLPYTPTAKQIGDMVPEEYNVVGQIDDAVASSQQKLRSKYDKDIADYFSNGEYSKGFDLLANSIVETAPTTIALMMGNAAGLTTSQSVLAGGAVFGADKMSELEKQNPDISQEQKVMVAAANGLLEGAFEQFGLTKLGDVTKEVLKKTGTEAAKKIAEEGFKKSYGKVLKQYLGTSAEEALSEAATQFAQNAVDKYSGANPDINLKDGVVDAAIIGLGAGASFSSPTTLLSIVKTKKALQQASKLADEKKALEEDIQSPDVPDAVKAAISEKIKSINEQEADIATEEKEKFNNLTPEGQQQVDQLLKKSNDISSVITDENVSDETRESFKKDLDAIDKEIDKVYETAVKPQEPAADTAPADEDTEAEIAYLNELKNTFGLEEQELARLVELQSGRPQAQVPAAETTESTSDQETVQETPTLEQPAQESPEPQTINTEQNGQETNQTEAGKEADVLTPEEQPAAQDVQPEEQEPAPAATNTTSKNDLIDPEEEADVKDSPESKAALEKDIEAMKQMKTQDLAEKKFIGMIERAWKAKEDGKISRKTYTTFRNTAKEILEGKVRAKDGVDATEAKMASAAAMDRVRQKLSSQGYNLFYDASGEKGEENSASEEEWKDKLKSLDGKSNKEVLSFVREETINKYYYPLIDAMISNSSKIEDFVSYRGTRDYASEASALYSTIFGQGILGLNPNAYKNPQRALKSILHEYVHVFTVNALLSKNKTQNEIEFSNKIKKVYDFLKNKAIQYNWDIESIYGLSDEFEFVSEIMTNGGFAFDMQTLNSLRDKNTKSFFQKIVDAIKSLFGIKTDKFNPELVDSVIKDILEFIPKSNPTADFDKTFSDEDGRPIDELLDLTNKLIRRGIDAGFSQEEAIKKTMSIVKLSPIYKKAIGTSISEKEFVDAINGMTRPKPTKKEASNENAGEQPSDISGPRRKKKTISRLENSDRLKEIASEMAEDDKFYTSISIPKASKHINDMLDSYQKEELLEDLAQKMIDGNSYFHPKITQWAAAKLSDRLRVIAEREGNEMQKSAINKLAAKLWSIRSNAVNIAATITGLESEIAKELPLSEEGLREVVNATIGGVQDTYFNNINKADTETAIQSFQEIMESEEGQKAIREAVDAEINRIAEATKGKEWVQAVDKTLDGLKIDLTDC